MEKTPIERLFETNPLEKEDIEIINKNILELVGIVSAQQKTIIDIKTLLESLIKKADSSEQLSYTVSKKLDDFINIASNVNNMMGGFSGGFQPFNQQPSQQRPVQMMRQQPVSPIQQPRTTNQGGATMGFDPMSVSAPNPEGTTQVLTPQQQAALQQFNGNRQFKR